MKDCPPHYPVVESHRDDPARGLSLPNDTKDRKHAVEDQIVDCRGRQGSQTEPKQDEINSHGIDDGIEMRRTVAVEINGSDGLLSHRTVLMLAGDKHVQLELVTVGGQR